jgi:hypothetical protein
LSTRTLRPHITAWVSPYHPNRRIPGSVANFPVGCEFRVGLTRRA